MGKAYDFPAIAPKSPAWQEDGSLRNGPDEDVYFSRHGGPGESRHVFLQGNDLPQRWSASKNFCIAELGFGCGLNFLVTLDEFSKVASDDLNLTYVAFERHPVPKETLEVLLAEFPDLPVQELLDVYPALEPGHHLLSVRSNLQLLLVLGDARQTLKDSHLLADAWYCDGFAPNKDDGLWGEELFRDVYERTKLGGTVATYSVARQVRENMRAAGFKLEKLEGYGTKREMLKGAKTEHRDRGRIEKPWCRGWDLAPDKEVNSVAVVGAGVAGAALAHRLAGRGIRTQVFESESLTQSGKFNPAALVQPFLNAESDWQSRFYHAAFLRARAVLKKLQQGSDEQLFDSAGVFKFGGKDGTSSIESTGCAGLPAGTFEQEALIVAPEKVVRALLNHKSISLEENVFVERVSHGEQGWSINGGEEVFDCVVFANGYRLGRALDGNVYPLVPVRGQSSLLHAPEVLSGLRCALEGDGFVLPLGQDTLLVGATYVRGDEALALRDTEHGENLKKLEPLLEGMSVKDVDGGYVGVRGTTPDRLPMVGPFEDRSAFLRDYGELKHGSLHRAFPEGTFMPGLYMSGGYGSWGFSGAFLGAAILCSLIQREPLPVSLSLFEHLLPSRFLIRDLERGKALNV